MTSSIWLAAAKQLGQDHANNAASWVCDGNSDSLERGRVLAMMNNGDPAVFDYLPRMPDLSGEFADGLTPLKLAEHITDMPTDELHASDGEIENDLATAYEEGTNETFETACEIELVKFLNPQKKG